MSAIFDTQRLTERKLMTRLISFLSDFSLKSIKYFDKS